MLRDVEQLCKIIGISEANIITAIEKLHEHEGHIESLQCKADILPIIVSHLQSNSFDLFKKTHESQINFKRNIQNLISK
jgi:hypothetical protein